MQKRSKKSMHRDNVIYRNQTAQRYHHSGILEGTLESVVWCDIWD